MRQWFPRIARHEQRALTDLAYGKTAAKRFDGLRRSNRNEAKMLLIAMVPAVPLALSDMLGFERGALWKMWAVVTGSWFVVVVGALLLVMLKSFLRSMADKNG